MGDGFCRNCRHACRFRMVAPRPTPTGRGFVEVCPGCDLRGAANLIGAWLDVCRTEFDKCVELAAQARSADRRADYLAAADQWLDLASGFVGAGR